MKYILQGPQRFLVTYVIEAASKDEAFEKLLNGEGECDDQIPESIDNNIDSWDIANAD